MSITFCSLLHEIKVYRSTVQQHFLNWVMDLWDQKAPVNLDIGSEIGFGGFTLYLKTKGNVLMFSSWSYNMMLGWIKLVLTSDITRKQACWCIVKLHWLYRLVQNNKNHISWEGSLKHIKHFMAILNQSGNQRWPARQVFHQCQGYATSVGEIVLKKDWKSR